MKHFTFIVAFLITVSARAGESGPGVDPRVDGQGMVRIVEDERYTIDDYLAWFAATFPETPATVIDAIESRRLYLFEVDLSGVDDNQVDALLESMGDFIEDNPPPSARWAEFNYFGGAPEGKSGSTWVTGIADAQDFNQQYARGIIGAGPAAQFSDGRATAVAVLDTGIDATHPELQGRVLPGYDFVRDGTDTSATSDGEDNDGDGEFDEMSAHGTFVAGIIAQTAPATKLIPVVVLNDDGTTNLWTMVQGMFYAIDRGVEVINMSLTTTYSSSAVEDAIDDARVNGIAIVGAAGNFDREEPREYPAMESGALGVASTTAQDIKSSFSNYHDKLNISAPGSNGSIDPGDAIIGPIPGGAYAIWEGTSFATAFVSGAVAMVRAQHPEWPASPGALTTLEITLYNASVNIDPLNPQYDEMLGEGRLDIAAAVAAAPPAPAIGDLNNDGVVGVDDLIAVINAWDDVHTSADLNVDGVVDVDDLLMVILAWT